MSLPISDTMTAHLDLRLSTGRLAAMAPLAVSGMAFGLYLLTCARTITWSHGGADGAELSAAAAVLGVAHPPGYPLYLLLGHLFTWLPIGEIAFRVGLLSVTAAALGVGLVAHLASSLGRQPLETAGRGEGGVEKRARVAQSAAPAAVPSILAAVAAGVALATAPLFWSQATIAEVYALHAALVLSALALLAAWRPGRDRLVVALALLFGVGMGNHATLGVLAGLAGLYVVALEPGLLRRRVAPLAVGAFLLGLLVYLYLPLRAAADPPINWGEPSDWPRFLAHVTAQSYRGYLGGRPLDEVLARTPVVARLVGEQFTWPGLVLALVGFGELMRRRRALGRLLLAYILVTVAFTLLYNAKDGDVYLMPVVLVLAVGFGMGMAQVAASRRGPALALALTVALAGWQIWTHGPAMDLSTDRVAADYARGILAAQSPGAVLQTDTDEHTFALWYVQVVEGLRPDVVLIDQRGLGLGWYRAQIERRHPGVLGPVARER